MNHARAEIDNTCKVQKKMAPIDSSIDSSDLSFEEQNSGKNKARKRKHDGIEFTEEHELPNGNVIG